MTDLLNRFRTPFLTGVGVVVLGIVLFMALISPQGNKLSKLHDQESQLQGQQTQLQTQIATLRRDKAKMAANCAALTKAIAEIPGTPSVDSFLQQVTALAVAAGDPNTPTISVTQAGASGAPAASSAASRATAAATAGAIPVQVTLTLQGNYAQMTSFLKGLDTFPRLFSVTSVKVAGGAIAAGGGQVGSTPTGYSLSLTGDIYYAAGHMDACGTSTAAAGSSAH